MFWLSNKTNCDVRSFFWNFSICKDFDFSMQGAIISGHVLISWTHASKSACCFGEAIRCVCSATQNKAAYNRPMVQGGKAKSFFWKIFIQFKQCGISMNWLTDYHKDSLFSVKWDIFESAVWVLKSWYRLIILLNIAAK